MPGAHTELTVWDNKIGAKDNFYINVQDQGEVNEVGLWMQDFQAFLLHSTVTLCDW